MGDRRLDDLPRGVGHNSNLNDLRVQTAELRPASLSNLFRYKHYRREGQATEQGAFQPEKHLLRPSSPRGILNSSLATSWAGGLESHIQSPSSMAGVGGESRRPASSSGEDRLLEELENSAASGQDEVVGMWEPGWSCHGLALLLF